MNLSTRTTVSVLGAIFGVSGFFHGLFEALQGSTPTPGLMINAIGPAQQMWSHGTEPALTLIPNFLVSGIIAMLVGLVLAVWALFFVGRKGGAGVLLLLFILLLLVGGGVAQTLFFPFICLAATRINKPLSWWRKVLPARVRQPLARLWGVSLGIAAGALAFALWLAITGLIPGVGNEDTVLAVMVGCLVTFIVLLPLTFVSGFARDAAFSTGQHNQPVAARPAN